MGYQRSRGLCHGKNSSPITAVVGHSAVGPAGQHVLAMTVTAIPDLYGRIGRDDASQKILTHPVGTACMAVLCGDRLRPLRRDLVESLAPLQGSTPVLYQQFILKLKSQLTVGPVERGSRRRSLGGWLWREWLGGGRFRWSWFS